LTFAGIHVLCLFMVTADDMAQAHEPGLALLFQRGLELALQIQHDAMAAETAEARARLAVAFHHISRSVRQTAALQMRLAREARRAAREDRDEAARAAGARRDRRDAKVRAAVEELIWTEVEEDDQVDVLTRLNERLEREDLADPDEPVDALIQRIAVEIGLREPPPGAPAPGAGSCREATAGVDAQVGRTLCPATPSPPSAELPLTTLRAGGASDDPDACRDHPWRSSG
jgi:hypothetical protein